MEISMYNTRSKLFITEKFYHAIGKSMEISMYSVQVDKNYWYSNLIILSRHLQIHGNFYENPMKFDFFLIASINTALSVCTNKIVVLTL